MQEVRVTPEHQTGLAISKIILITYTMSSDSLILLVVYLLPKMMEAFVTKGIV